LAIKGTAAGILPSPKSVVHREAATLLISHAGLNTTLTALGCKRGGIGDYREQAQRLQAESQAAGGKVKAADLIESASG